MEIKIYMVSNNDSSNVLAKIIDENNKIYKIGLGIENKDKSNTELEGIAIEKYNEIKFREANPPPPPVQELREKEYLAQGITIDKTTIALWERVVENRPEASNLLQAKREAVKAKIPKV